ncbi:MAG: SAM-dependent methyltransferase, partial [Alphaproteobacteria bacterium]|nr:SAM-dependent methyltransferase [Alphaproteobacteria bacterium]
MHVLTSTKGQKDLPRYFSSVFDVGRAMNRGRLDIVLPDQRRFRAEGKTPGPAGELVVHNDALFSRLIREGDLGF